MLLRIVLNRANIHLKSYQQVINKLSTYVNNYFTTTFQTIKQDLFFLINYDHDQGVRGMRNRDRG